MPKTLKLKIRDIPDFPRTGIMFKDITPLLHDAHSLKKSVKLFMDYYTTKGLRVDKVVAAESRGFIFGALLAYELDAGFVPLRKKGKLPFKTLKQNYELEYGKESLEIHVDAIKPKDNVLFVDDLLATGGTAEASIKLVKRLKGKPVGCAFLIELAFLHGRDKLKGIDVFSLITYDE